MKKLIYTGLLLLAISCFSACTTYDYYQAGLNKTNMSGYHSFAWMPMGNAKGGSMQADAAIKDAATQNLSQKGLRLQQRNPDLLISYSTQVGTGTRTYYYPDYGYGYGGFYPGFGFGWGGWGGGFGGWGRFGYRPYYYAYGAPFAYGYGGYPSTEHYKEGTIIIDLIDVRTKQVVWRGFGVGEVHHNPQKNIDDLPKVVAGVLDQLKLTAPAYAPRMRMGPGPVRRPTPYQPTSNSI